MPKKFPALRSSQVRPQRKNCNQAIVRSIFQQFFIAPPQMFVAGRLFRGSEEDPMLVSQTRHQPHPFRLPADLPTNVMISGMTSEILEWASNRVLQG